MKALTLKQPWADLVARGIKTYETRSWRTLAIGGFLAIHASKSTKDDHLAHQHPFAEYYSPLGNPALRHSEIVCVVRVLGCYKTEEVYQQQWYFLKNGTEAQHAQATKLLALGDFSPKRWAWKLEVVATLDGIKAPGLQRIWTLPPNIAEQVEAQIAAKTVPLGGGGISQQPPQQSSLI